MARQRRRRRAGFTLIELLVAISVLALVAVLGWRGLDGIVRARIALNQQLAQTRGLQLAFAQLQSDCARIVPTALLAGHSILAVEQERLLLVRTVYADDQPMRLQVVGYRLQDGVLTRQESAPTRDLTELNGFWLAAQNNRMAGPVVALGQDVAAITMRVWGTDRLGWRTPADAAAANTAAVNADANANANAPTPAPAPALTGLEVSLQLREQPSGMVKVFLLGAV